MMQANPGTTVPTDQTSHVGRLDSRLEDQRQHDQQLLVWGLCVAALLFVAVVAGVLRVRRIAAAKEADRLFREFQARNASAR